VGSNEAKSVSPERSSLGPARRALRTAVPPAQVLEAHKGQPAIEKRFEKIETVHEFAPVFLKNEGRIEALFTLYFLALLVQALIARELRLAMKREKIARLPIYPAQRFCPRPTTEQILGLYSLVQRHKLAQDGQHRANL
jgi:hypothetical protein